MVYIYNLFPLDFCRPNLRQNNPSKLFPSDFPLEPISRKPSVGYFCMTIFRKSTAANFPTANFYHKFIANNSITIFCQNFLQNFPLDYFYRKNLMEYREFVVVIQIYPQIGSLMVLSASASKMNISMYVWCRAVGWNNRAIWSHFTRYLYPNLFPFH